MTDVIVLGAGAAGLYCASVAASRGLSVVIIEHNRSSGKKIRISGGGRCNFTNRVVSHKNFVSDNPEFARSALARFQPQHFIDLVDSYNISWHEKTLGQLFCDGSAQQIIDMLEAECSKHQVKIIHDVSVLSTSKSDHFRVNTTAGEMQCRNLVVATGGLSIPPLGASDVGYRIAKHFGLDLITPQPALVPILCDGEFLNQYGELAGLSFFAEATAYGTSFQEGMLFTHRGLSGPVILQASLYLPTNGSITINTIPNTNADSLYAEVQTSKKSVQSALSELLPIRFIKAHNVDGAESACNAVGKKKFVEIVNEFKSWSIQTIGTEGFAKAEVTRGGVNTKELSSKNMECKNVPGLFFIGEVVDVTGWLGGYNFQWAWSSATAAGQGII